MIKVFVDSGSSIKEYEKEKYNVEIVPLKLLIKDKEYLDGINLSMEEFYNALINEKQFPKTSLPSLEDAKNKVDECVKEGHSVVILTISSGISGTFNALNTLFNDYENVKVIDTQTAVGGMRIIVNEINKYRDYSLDFVVEKINQLIPKIMVFAVPETLTYLHRGGRLSKIGYAAGSLLRIKPIIQLKYGVNVAHKTIGLKKAMDIIISKLKNCDVNYPIVPSFTYSDENLDKLIDKTPLQYRKAMIEKDNLAPAIACHWGPNAFGYIFVSK